MKSKNAEECRDLWIIWRKRRTSKRISSVLQTMKLEPLPTRVQLLRILLGNLVLKLMKTPTSLNGKTNVWVVAYSTHAVPDL
jgi:hypothetical protein